MIRLYTLCNLFFKNYYYFFAVLSLHCCMGFSLVAESGVGGTFQLRCSAFSCFRAWGLGRAGCSSCGFPELEHRLGRFGTWASFPHSTWDPLVLLAQSCPTLCDPMGCSLPGSSVRGIFQARILEWVAISFSRGSSRPGD